MKAVKDGGDYTPQAISQWRLTELLQHEKDYAKVLELLEREGYRRCDAPACNCGSWHKP